MRSRYALLFPCLVAASACDSERNKGASVPVAVWVESGGVLAEDGTVLHSGDRVQVVLAPGPWIEAWLTDGDRIIAVFPVHRDRRTFAPFSLRLDDQPGSEEIDVIVSEAPLATLEVEAVLAGRSESGVRSFHFRFEHAP